MAKKSTKPASELPPEVPVEEAPARTNTPRSLLRVPSTRPAAPVEDAPAETADLTTVTE